MRRIMWIGVALLVMFAILGYGWLSMKNIEEINKRRREKDAGKAEVARIIATEATTSVWDKLHAEQETGVSETAQESSASNNGQFVSSKETSAPEADAPPEEHPIAESVIVNAS